MNKRISLVKIAAWLACSASLFSCSASKGCGEYREMINDESVNHLLIEWADREVFSRVFERKNFEKFDKFVGPGKGGANFNIETANITIPTLLAGYSIRSVGPDRDRPDVILIGKRRYQGILITRADFYGSLNKIGGEPLHIVEHIGRTGMLCYEDF